MARKRYSDEDALKLLREIDVHLHDGLDVVSSCRKAGVSDKTYSSLEFTVNVRTGPQSLMSLSIHETEAALNAITEKHKQFIESASDLVKAIFSMKAK